MAVTDARVLAAVFVGGAAGTVARVLLAESAPAHGSGWPWATFVANVLGAAVLGFVAARFPPARPGSRYRRALLGTGLCGGLTTFSTVQVEVLAMVDAGRLGLAAGYVGAGVATGVTAVCAGRALGRRVRRR